MHLITLYLSIVAVTKFSFFHVIGARSLRCPITGIRLELFVIEYPRDLLVIHSQFNVSNMFQALQTFSLQRSSQKTFKLPKFVIFLFASHSSDFEITHAITALIIYKQQFLHADWLRACQLIPNQCKKVKLSAKFLSAILFVRAQSRSCQSFSLKMTDSS